MTKSIKELWLNNLGLFLCNQEGGSVMPFRFRKPCSYQGCPNLTKERYCDEHKHLEVNHKTYYHREVDSNIRYGNKWTKVRRLYVRHHPLCEMCLKEGKFIPVEEVHHIIPLSQGGTNDFSNLMSLCQSCHTKLHYQIGDRK